MSLEREESTHKPSEEIQNSLKIAIPEHAMWVASSGILASLSAINYVLTGIKIEEGNKNDAIFLGTSAVMYTFASILFAYLSGEYTRESDEIEAEKIVENGKDILQEQAPKPPYLQH